MAETTFRRSAPVVAVLIFCLLSPHTRGRAEDGSKKAIEPARWTEAVVDSEADSELDFPADFTTWSWFTYAPEILAPIPYQNDALLAMTETVTTRVVFGSWESPKNPGLRITPTFGRIFRAKFHLISDVEGERCPGFRFRAITAHIVETTPTIWQPDFTNPDFNADTSVYYSTNDTFYVPGREPGTAGTTYTILHYPQQVFSLGDPDMTTYFTCDLLDLDTFDSDAGTIFIDHVVIDSFTRPGDGTGVRVAELSFNDRPGANDFSSWETGINRLDPELSYLVGINVSRKPESVAITVTRSNQWFDAYAVSPGVPLIPGAYYRAVFSIASTETGSGEVGPTVRAGFASDRFVFSVDKQLAGGSSLARFRPEPSEFEVWMMAPTPFEDGMTEPMHLRFQSWRPENNSGWPFFKDVSGTITCDWVSTERYWPWNVGPGW